MKQRNDGISLPDVVRERGELRSYAPPLGDRSPLVCIDAATEGAGADIMSAKGLPAASCSRSSDALVLACGNMILLDSMRQATHTSV